MKHFAFEICAKFEPGGRLHTELRKLVTEAEANPSLPAKCRFYKRAIDELQVAAPLFERGCWDYRGSARYLTWTMAFLMIEGSHTDLAVRRLCDFPDSRLWHRDTFQKILWGLGVLNFASIKSDVSYLIPRDVGWGLTVEDLAQPKFQYLRPLL